MVLHLLQIAAAFGWLLALIVACTFIFITYTKNRDGGEPWTLVQQAVYESVGRPAWATCIAWVIFACFNGAGGTFYFVIIIIIKGHSDMCLDR